VITILVIFIQRFVFLADWGTYRAPVDYGLDLL